VPSAEEEAEEGGMGVGKVLSGGVQQRYSSATMRPGSRNHNNHNHKHNNGEESSTASLLSQANCVSILRAPVAGALTRLPARVSLALQRSSDTADVHSGSSRNSMSSIHWYQECGIGDEHCRRLLLFRLADHLLNAGYSSIATEQQQQGEGMGMGYGYGSSYGGTSSHGQQASSSCNAFIAPLRATASTSSSSTKQVMCLRSCILTDLGTAHLTAEVLPYRIKRPALQDMLMALQQQQQQQLLQQHQQQHSDKEQVVEEELVLVPTGQSVKLLALNPLATATAATGPSSAQKEEMQFLSAYDVLNRRRGYNTYRPANADQFRAYWKLAYGCETDACDLLPGQPPEPVPVPSSSLSYGSCWMALVRDEDGCERVVPFSALAYAAVQLPITTTHTTDAAAASSTAAADQLCAVLQNASFLSSARVLRKDWTDAVTVDLFAGATACTDAGADAGTGSSSGAAAAMPVFRSARSIRDAQHQQPQQQQQPQLPTPIAAKMPPVSTISNSSSSSGSGSASGSSRNNKRKPTAAVAAGAAKAIRQEKKKK
jgi:hypothetical protein